MLFLENNKYLSKNNNIYIFLTIIINIYEFLRVYMVIRGILGVEKVCRFLVLVKTNLNTCPSQFIPQR